MFGESQYRWIYDVNSSASWHSSFADRFRSPDIAFLQEHEDENVRFYWTSHHFDDLETPQAVHDRAMMLKALFDGALFLAGYDTSDVQLGALHQYPGENRVTKPSTFDVLASPFSQKHLLKEIDKFDNPSDDLIANAVFLCRTDKACHEILSLLGVNGVTWVSLYAALDTVKWYGWNEAKIVNDAKVSASELKAFTGTANNVNVIGALARHGESGFGIPTKTMTLDEAEIIMRKVLRAFFDAPSSQRQPLPKKPKK